jgi:hypothetical protein
MEETPPACKNAELCRNTVVPEICDDCCMTCGSWFKLGFGWNALEFRDTDKRCSVCMEQTGRELRFPACSHWFCVSCCRDILFWDETRYHLDPVPYGCPRCIHVTSDTPSCNSRPCCEEDDAVMEDWERASPSQHAQWNHDQMVSIETPHPNFSYGCKKCPLCRAEYKRIN